MRAIFSYGLALVIVLVIAVWLGSGVLVIGGKGPGNGESSIVGAATKVASANQSLSADAAAKAKAAEAAKLTSDAAAAAAAAAQTELQAADSADRKKQLTEELEARNKAAAEAKAKADAADAEAKKSKDEADAAEVEAAKTKTELDAATTIAERNQNSGNGQDATPRSVRIMTALAQPMSIDVPLRGRTKAKAAITIAAQTAGTVQKVNVSKGQKVKAGDLICVLDQGARQAAVDQAKAGVDQAQLAYDTNAKLREKGLSPPNSEAALSAALKGAQAGFENARIELGRTEIKTEISGVVQDPLANVGSVLGMGAPCASVVQLDPMLFIASVPEAKVAYARLGLPATITTVTGDIVEGKVTYIASTADDATRSFAVEIELPNTDGKLRDGITAEATVKVGTAPAQLLPQSVLTLDDNGVLGIRTVEAGNKVAFHKVDIVKDTREGVWIIGLPAKINVITVGQEFVQPGQIVDARTADGAKPS